MRPKVVDLFAGAGGFSLGFESAGFDVVAALDNDPVNLATHKYNFPDAKTIYRSVSEITGDEILGFVEGQIDVVIGGPPCQGFSVMGKRLVDDDRNRLVRDFFRLVSEIRPRYFVMENVPGITLGAYSRILDDFLEDVLNGGYRVVRPIQALNAANFGVPQDRNRVFLLGARRDQPFPQYPCAKTKILAKTPDSNEPKSNLKLNGQPYGPSAGQALSGLPNIENFESLLMSNSVKYTLRPNSGYAKFLHGIKREAGDFSYPRRWDSTLLTCSARTIHTQETIKRFSKAKRGEFEKISRFYRIHSRGICNTIRAGTSPDRGSFMSPRPIHPRHHRCISVREGARLHSYPDWFRFHETKWHGFMQIGNSVPPLLARAVAREILKAMGGKARKPQRLVELGEEGLLKVRGVNAENIFLDEMSAAIK